MADKVKFDLVSPEKLLLSEEVDMVTLPGTEGRFGVLAHHAPLMTTLSPGVVEIRNEGADKHYFVRGGFADVTPAGLTLLAEEALLVDDISPEWIDNRIKDLESDLEHAELDETKTRAAAEIEELKLIRTGL